jgi:hypothetical protein
MEDRRDSYKIPDPYHPNAVETHVENFRQEALQSLGLDQKVAQYGLEALSEEEAAQVGQATAERLQALKANVNQQSE